MACSKCSAKKRRNEGAKAPTPAQPLAGREFVRMKYVGPDGLVTSSIPRTTYGNRKAGEIMSVIKEDIEALPGLWEAI